MNLLPYPKTLKRGAGSCVLRRDGVLHLDAALPRDSVMLPIAERLQAACEQAGATLELTTGPARHPRLMILALPGGSAPKHQEGYDLTIRPGLIEIRYHDIGGLRAAVATLRQIIAEHGKRLPCVKIRDYPDFAKRGVMLDVSRGRVPNLETLLDLAENLAGFKINELQLYTEHTFAYRNYAGVWEGWGPLTAEDMLRLDARCRELGIELVPNQNTFGHLRYWLEYPPLKKLAEVKEPYEGVGGTFLRYPTTLAPQHPGTLSLLRELFDELLPCFTSCRFNVGCDETWDLGLGQSKEMCERLGKGRVYVDFLKRIYDEVKGRGHQMMFWGDIILNHPELLQDLPRDIVALNWGYEANHPFEKETSLFEKSGMPFYVCPGTSTWMSLIGRHDNAFANLRAAAEAGKKHGAEGYLNTDWGDGGHPQPLAVSYLPYLLGASLSWNPEHCEDQQLVKVLSRDIFHDPTQRAAQAALNLGRAHRKFDYLAPNVTPFGTVVTAPPPKLRELVCRDGMKYYARIGEKNIRAARAAVEQERALLYRSEPVTVAGEMLALELDMAARMAAQSCDILLWQQALAAGREAQARTMARKGVRELQDLERDFEAYWPLRNKGTTAKCSGFFKWRMEDYRRGILHYAPEQARIAQPKTYAAE